MYFSIRIPCICLSCELILHSQRRMGQRISTFINFQKTYFVLRKFLWLTFVCYGDLAAFGFHNISVLDLAQFHLAVGINGESKVGDSEITIGSCFLMEGIGTGFQL